MQFEQPQFTLQHERRVRSSVPKSDEKLQMRPLQVQVQVFLHVRNDNRYCPAYYMHPIDKYAEVYIFDSFQDQAVF